MSGIQDSLDQVSQEDVISELIRLREQDRIAAAQLEQDLRSEIQALWLRLPERSSTRPSLWRLFCK